jgi:hypothetical protein
MSATHSTPQQHSQKKLMNESNSSNMYKPNLKKKLEPINKGTPQEEEKSPNIMASVSKQSRLSTAKSSMASQPSVTQLS